MPARSETARTARFRESEIARFLGRIDRGLELYDALAEEGSLAQEVTELRNREAALARKISKAAVQERQKRGSRRLRVLQVD